MADVSDLAIRPDAAFERRLEHALLDLLLQRVDKPGEQPRSDLDGRQPVADQQRWRRT